MWVLATLIDASIKGYELVWEPLGRERRDQFHEFFCRFRIYFGLKEEVGPANYAEFVDLYEEMLSGDLLGSNPLGAEVASAVLRPQYPRRVWMLGKVVDFLPIETVPEKIRERLEVLRRVTPFGFRVSDFTEVGLRVLTFECLVP